MLIVNNIDKLKNIIEFEKGSYYKFVALIRAKDYNTPQEQILKCMNNQVITIKTWFVDNQERLEALLPDMLTVINLFKCRLYMCTDRKSTLKTLIQMRNKIQNYLDPCLGKSNVIYEGHVIKRICSSASNLDESSDRGFRRWLFDIDSKDQNLVKFIKEQICGENYLETFETKSGYHIIANKAFSIDLLDEYKTEVTAKKNAMVLVAMEE